MMKRNCVLLDVEEEGVHQICSFMWAEYFWITSHSKEHLEQMAKKIFFKKHVKWTWSPNQQVRGGQARMASEDTNDMLLGTWKGCYKFPCEDEFRILACAMNRQGRTCGAVEERMQSAKKAFWKDIMIYKSKDVPWKVKCQRLVDHVYAVCALGNENWSWTLQTYGKF